MGPAVLPDPHRQGPGVVQRVVQPEGDRDEALRPLRPFPDRREGDAGEQALVGKADLGLLDPDRGSGPRGQHRLREALVQRKLEGLSVQIGSFRLTLFGEINPALTMLLAHFYFPDSSI